MTTTADRYRAALQPFSTLAGAVPTSGWDAASPCAGWSARDVLAHLIDTQRDLLAGHGVDLGSAPDLRTDPARGWRQHTDAVLTALADPDLVARGYDGHFGPTTVGETLERFYVWDMYVHRWDLARAVGRPAELSDDELDRIEQGADGFGAALYLEGICRSGVEVPAHADRTTRLLARLGRVA